MILEDLETIDDDCDRHGIILVKLDNREEAEQYGIEEIPALVYFEDKIPHLFEGNLASENEVLGWLIHQMKHEEIEHVTDEMLDMLINDHRFVAALFYDPRDRMSGRILNELENIDDDAEKKDIVMVKLKIEDDDTEILTKFNITGQLPRLALFEDNQTVQLYDGDLVNEDEALNWLVQATIDQEVPVAMNLKKPEPAATSKKESAPKAKDAKVGGAVPEDKPKSSAPPPKTEAKPKPNLSADRKPTKDPKPKSALEEPMDDDKEPSEAEEAIKILNEERNVVAFFCK